MIDTYWSNLDGLLDLGICSVPMNGHAMYRDKMLIFPCTKFVNEMSHALASWFRRKSVYNYCMKLQLLPCWHNILVMIDKRKHH